MLARVTAFVVWALVAAAAVFWGMRLWARPLATPAHAVPVADTVALTGDLTRLLGKPPVAPSGEGPAPASPALASRFRLVGVMAPRAGRADGAGLALIAVDGKPARAFRPGSPIDGDLVLQSVGLRTAAIGPAQGAAAVLLEVPRMPPPATGSLPPPLAGLPGFAPTPTGPAMMRGTMVAPPGGAVLPQIPFSPQTPAPGALRETGPLTQ